VVVRMAVLYELLAGPREEPPTRAEQHEHEGELAGGGRR
jgi:hypothetical protein